MGENRGVDRRLIQGKIAKDHANLAGFDVALLQIGQDVVMEGGAVGTGQRRVFDDRDRRISIADRALADFGRRTLAEHQWKRDHDPKAEDSNQASGQPNKYLPHD